MFNLEFSVKGHSIDIDDAIKVIYKYTVFMLFVHLKIECEIIAI